jgi:DNA-binding NarL/FixJ family response regulator
VVLNIFIAEEYPVLRQGIRALIEGQPEWKVCGETANSGEVIEKITSLHPDVLLLDVTLPNMDIARAISEIMAVCPTVKIVALAAPGTGEPAAKALAAGAIGLAMKSDTASDLLAALRNIGNSRPFLSSASVTLFRGPLAKNRKSEALPKDLTPREIEVLRLLAKGLTNREVAASLDISVKTVDVHRAGIMRKLELATYSDLIQFAIRYQLIEI